MKLVVLESVSTALDTESGMTYSLAPDGTPNMYDGMHVDEIVSDEWFYNLSKEDAKLVKEIKHV
jgi:hypothetical protein